MTILLKGLAGGALVVAFALLSQSLKPKRFAGLFGAAPAVAIAGLALALASKGAHEARDDSLGMIAGSVGMLVYALATTKLVRSGRSLAGTAVGLVTWAVPTAAVLAVLLI